MPASYLALASSWAPAQKGITMKFFIDTADLAEIKTAYSWGCVAGVTTNPSLYAKTDRGLAAFEADWKKVTAAQ